MKKPARFGHYFLALACLIFFILGVFELAIQFTPLKKSFTERKPEGLKEEYAPELNYLNSMAKLDAHTDSMVAVSPLQNLSAEALYPNVLNDIVRKRFYHGLFRYSVGNNFVAFLATKISGRSWNEVWKADDILKSPHAFCGQQSLVEMELLIKRGYKVRSVNMQAPAYKNGHFAFEAFYDNKWHYFDPDMEPNTNLLMAEGRPSLEELRSSIIADRSILTSLYPNANADVLYALFNNYRIGEVNQLMPARTYVFATVTKALSYLSSLFSLLIYFLFLKKVRFSVSVFRLFNSLRIKHRHPVPTPTI